MTPFKIFKRYVAVVSQRNRSIPIAFLGRSLILGVMPLVNMFLPKLLLESLSSDHVGSTLAFLILSFLFLNLTLSYTASVLQKQIDRFVGLSGYYDVDALSKKTLNLSLDTVERKSTRDLLERAQYSVYGIRSYIESISLLLSSSFSILFGAIILVNDYSLLLLVAIVGVIVSLPFLGRIRALDVENTKHNILEERSYRYLTDVATDHRFAKDLRLYKGLNYFTVKAKRVMDAMVRRNHHYINSVGKMNGALEAITQFEIMAVLLVLARDVVSRLLSVANFTMVFGAAQSVIKGSHQLIKSSSEIAATSLSLEPYFDYLDLPETQDEGTLELHDFESLCFENVSFAYPNASSTSLDNVSFTIHQGETLALVGENGAGKTTLIKLLCRFYKPSSGRITMNGIAIEDISIEAYRRLLAPVFQDFQLFPWRIDENIACEPYDTLTPEDTQALNEAAQSTGLSQWVTSSGGFEQFLFKGLSDTGVIPSGGQQQKLAIMRALFHNAPLVILDEPTAALDPKAEEAVFNDLRTLTRGKTAIFISHRLSSTRIADRILVFKDGRLLESGTHRDLMASSQHYATLYTSQAKQFESVEV